MTQTEIVVFSTLDMVLRLPRWCLARRCLSFLWQRTTHNVLSNRYDFRILADKTCRLIKTDFVVSLESQTITGILSNTLLKTKTVVLCENRTESNWKQWNFNSPIYTTVKLIFQKQKMSHLAINNGFICFAARIQEFNPGHFLDLNYHAQQFLGFTT